MTAVAIPGLDRAPTTHTRLLSWVREVAELTAPDRNGKFATYDLMRECLAAMSVPHSARPLARDLRASVARCRPRPGR